MATIDTTNPPQVQADLNADPSLAIIEDEAKDHVDQLNIILPVEEFIHSTNGPFATIDVQPDYHVYFASLFSELMPLMDQLLYDKHETISPPSIFMYFFYMLYSYAAANDTFGLRFTPSVYSSQCYSDPTSRQVLEYAMYLYVPPMLADYTRSAASVPDATRHNMAYINTFACFDLYHDLGRTFPLMLFVSLHNALAKMRTNTTVDNLLHKWYQTTLFAYGPPGQQVDITVANIIGANPNNNIYENIIAKCFRQMVVTYLNKPVRSRPVLKTIIVPVQTTDQDIHHTNPYWYLLCHVPQQCRVIASAMDEISTCIHDRFEKCIMLYEVYSIQSGLSITNHYY